jgi:hypothetical protein
MAQWDYAVERVRAADLIDTLARFSNEGLELIAVVPEEYVEVKNVSAETGGAQVAFSASMYRVIAKRQNA